jgi:hypothetical protein
MNEDELKLWFWNIFNSCYPVKHDDYIDSLFLYYDKLYLRKCALLKLLGKEIIEPNIINGKCLFILNLKTGFMWCDSYDIWDFLRQNYTTTHGVIQPLIINCLYEITPSWSDELKLAFKEYIKMNISTLKGFGSFCDRLQEPDKLKIVK